MTLATGSNTSIGYITEVTAGTTPGTPAFNLVPINDFSLVLTKDTFTDPTIQQDRQAHFFKHGNRKVGGDVSVTLLGVGATPTGNTLFDPWFESAMNAAWTANVLKIGNTSKSFTFEKRITDSAGTVNYFRYKGTQCTGFSFDVALNAPVKAKFTFAGLDVDPLATAIITGATYVAVPTAPQPFIHINANNLFKEGGSATTLMTAFSINLVNGADVNYALGSAVAQSITPSKAQISGSCTFYFSDATLYNKFVNETATSLSVKLSDGTRSLQFDLGTVVYGAATQVINNENTVIVTMPYTAVYDTTNTSTLMITRA